jgi:hypothetical protein
MAKLPDNYGDYAGYIEDALYELKVRMETAQLDIENAKAGLIDEVDKYRDKAVEAERRLMNIGETSIRSRGGASMTIDTGWYHEIRRQAMEECRKVLTSMIGEAFEFGTDPLQVAERRMAELTQMEELAIACGEEDARTYRTLSKRRLPAAQHFDVKLQFTKNSEGEHVAEAVEVDTGGEITRYLPVEVVEQEEPKIGPIVNVEWTDDQS